MRNLNLTVDQVLFLLTKKIFKEHAFYLYPLQRKNADKFFYYVKKANYDKVETYLKYCKYFVYDFDIT